MPRSERRSSGFVLLCYRFGSSVSSGQLRAQGATVPDDLLTHVAPLGWEHIGLTGDYVWTEANPAAPFRPLREVRFMFQPLAA